MLFKPIHAILIHSLSECAIAADCSFCIIEYLRVEPHCLPHFRHPCGQ